MGRSELSLQKNLRRSQNNSRTRGAKMSCIHKTSTLLLSIAILFAMILQETSQMVPSCHGNDDECPPGQKCFRPYAGADYKCVYKCSGRDDECPQPYKMCHCYESLYGVVATDCECVGDYFYIG